MTTFTGTNGDDSLPPAGADNSGDDDFFALGGNDTVHAGLGNDSVDCSSGNDVAFGEDGDDFLNGGADNDRLYGGNGVDQLDGGGGNDIVDGGAGADVMTGNFGDDKYYVDDVGDTITEFSAGDGIDLVFSSVTFTLSQFVDNMILTGSANLDGTGNGDANQLTGNAGANQLSGLGGNDTLDGGAGDDIMFGGAGNDAMRGSAGADHYDGGDGVDVVNYTSSSGVNVFLDGSGTNGKAALGDTFVDVENILGGTGADFIVGSAVANRLVGNDGNDILWGRAGDDQLEGGNGDDRLLGQQGNDVLVGGAGADTFAFTLAPAAGGLDRTNDFVHLTDRIEVDASLFGGGLVAGGAVQLVTGPSPSSAGIAGGVFLYNTLNGFLSWDADGQGAGAAVAFFRLQNLPVLTTADFAVVA